MKTNRVTRHTLVLCGTLLLFATTVGRSGTPHLFAEEPKRGVSQSEADSVTFRKGENSLQIAIGGQTIAEYVFRDDAILRPYFQHLRTRSGALVTRNHPPVKGEDLDDHSTMHPGLWLAFGDLDGADFWRNKGRVRHLQFTEEPKRILGGGSFAAQSAYEVEGRTICTETCEIAISVRPNGYLLDWKSTFQSKLDFTFGDQEEMGLGVRVVTPLAVAKGGEIIDSESRKNGAQIWGKQADWCQYSGVVDRQRIGVVLMPAPQNFRRSWFHARDYGLLVANPFGRNAFTKDEKSRITVKQGDDFRLRFGVLVYEVPTEDHPIDIAGIYGKFSGK